jgi:predicted  nucleic acid-binding Zn-ribbon protein
MIYTSDKERIERLTAERDEARRDAERWQADALRLLNERNAAQGERDEARREVVFLRPSVCLGAQTAHEYAQSRDWDCFGGAA